VGQGVPAAAPSGGAAPRPQALQVPWPQPPARNPRPRPSQAARTHGPSLPAPSRTRRPGPAPPSPPLPPATNRKDTQRHQQPPPPIQKASRHTKRAAHWLPAQPPLCKPPPHSASLRDIPPPYPPFLGPASHPAFLDWMSHLPLVAGRSPIGRGKFAGQPNRPLLRYPRAGCRMGRARFALIGRWRVSNASNGRGGEARMGRREWEALPGALRVGRVRGRAGRTPGPSGAALTGVLRRLTARGARVPGPRPAPLSPPGLAAAAPRSLW